MKELTKAEEMVLMTIRRLDDQAYGVAIKRKIQETTGKAIPYGTLYFILDQLTAKEYVNRTKGDPTPERGGRRKIYYSLSTEGMQALKTSFELQRKVWDDAESLLGRMPAGDT